MHIASSIPADIQQALRDLYAIVRPLDETRAIDWKSRRLSQVGDATEDDDAITKGAVDALIASVRADAGLDTGEGPGGSLDGASGVVRMGAYAVRGSAAAHAGELFLATDRNNVAFISNGATWKYAFGVQYGTLSPDTKPTLTSNDTGYRFRSTDFAREYYWTGSAWDDSPGQPARWVVAFSVVNGSLGTGWHKLDGTASVPYSNADGTTGTTTLPDFITNKRFARSNSTVGGAGGSATTHTHSIDPPNTTSGSDSGGGTVVQSGTGTTVAQHTHTHDTNIAAFTSAGPSGTSGDDALPPYYDCIPWVRL